jgi:hypothetical protein
VLSNIISTPWQFGSLNDYWGIGLLNGHRGVGLMVVEVLKLQFAFASVQWCSGGSLMAVGVSFRLEMKLRL